MESYDSTSLNDAMAKIPSYISKCFKRLSTEKVEWQSNVVVIIGERGAGKSVALKNVVSILREERESLDGNQPSKNSKYIVLDPLDCTQLPSEIPLGLAVLLHIKNHGALNHFHNGLDYLVRRLCRFHEKYNDLCMNISNSAEEFGDYLSKNIEERLKIKKELDKLLEEAQNHKCFSEGVVVPLDDFDLIQKADHKKWFRSLLDEMHQTRMVFLVTADFHRLQHQSYGEDPGDDIKTGHAIINKLFPPASRFWLKSWSLEEAVHYPAEGDNSLFTRLESQGGALGLPFPLLYQLIPSLPRGWHGIHSRLAEWQTSDDKQTVEEMLSLIANCREEVLLARKLRDQALGSWIDELPLVGETIDQPAWDELVESACRRARSKLEVIPRLPSFFKPELPKIELSSFVHDPRWGAPLRRDQYYQFTLRDAVKSAPYWAELLTDIGLSVSIAKSTGESESGVYRNRLKLMNRWEVLASRFKRAVVELRFDRVFLLDYFSFKANPPYYGGLFWFEEVMVNDSKAELTTLAFGWPVLMRRLASDDPFHMNLRESLLVGTEDLKGSALDLTESELYDFLPDQVWCFVLLADGLTRCPWSVVSAYRNWQLPVYLGLTVAFVRSAYVYALRQINPNLALSQAQSGLYEVLKSQDFSSLARGGELKLIQFLDQLFKDDLQVQLARIESKGLVRALNAFLASPLYGQVVAHFQRHATITAHLAKVRGKSGA